jgi:hypothetical protein
MTEINNDYLNAWRLPRQITHGKKRDMEHQMISKAPELDESEIKALIENFETIGVLLKEHATIFSNPILTPESKKMCNEGLVLIKKFTQKCLEHYGMRYLSK